MALQLPSSFKPTHQTAGLSGFPAADIFGTPGTPVLSPIDGVITKLSGRPPSAGAYQGAGGPFGYSVYVHGSDGRTYFLTHFGTVGVRVGQRVGRGQPIGTVGDYPGATPDHIHEGLHTAGGGIGSTITGAAAGAAGAVTDAAGAAAGAVAGVGAKAVSAALDTFFGGFFDQLKSDAGKILLTVGLVALGAALTFAGVNRMAGGAPVRAAKSAGRAAARIPVPVPA